MYRFEFAQGFFTLSCIAVLLIPIIRVKPSLIIGQNKWGRVKTEDEKACIKSLMLSHLILAALSLAFGLSLAFTKVNVFILIALFIIPFIACSKVVDRLVKRYIKY